MDVLTKLGLTAAVMAILIVRRVRLVYVMSIASLVLGLLFGFQPLTIMKHMLSGFLTPETATLIVTLAAVMVLERMMVEQEIIHRLVDRAQEALPDPRVTMATLPAFMGLLPSAGGAVVSCPMVDQVSTCLNVDAERKVYINYWFRHVWEYWFPLYQGVVLAVSILGVNLGSFMIWGLPFSLFTVAVGMAVGFWGLKSQMELTQVQQEANRWQAWQAFFQEAWPIIAIIGLVLVLKVNVAVATVLILGALFINRRYKIQDIPRLLGVLTESDIILTVAAIMAFRGMLEASGAVSALPKIFAAFGISSLIAILGLPFFTGLLTGSSAGLVGISFPLIRPLLLQTGTINMRWVALAYAAGKAGLMLSPLHLCFSLSATYFRANAGKVWLLVAISEVVVLTLGVLFYQFII
ncbi:MAG TPA: DUF401 family protein [Firmicutes bacterium]|nr:DUF401 family protein [Bacillota bacterium]